METIPLMLSSPERASCQQDRSAWPAARHMVECGDRMVEGLGDADGQRQPSRTNTVGECIEGFAVGLEDGPGIARLRRARSDNGANPAAVAAAGQSAAQPPQPVEIREQWVHRR